MPTKAEMYAQMVDKVATQLTGSWQEWAGFLTTAARLYKYPFHEQMMIYVLSKGMVSLFISPPVTSRYLSIKTCKKPSIPSSAPFRKAAWLCCMLWLR